MQTLPMYRDSRSPHDDVSPAQLPRWVDSLPQFEARQMIQPAPDANDLALHAIKAAHPAEHAEALRGVQAIHALDARDASPMAWRTIARYDLKHAHRHVTLGQVDDVIKALEDAGSVVRKSLEGWGGTSVTRYLVIEARASAMSLLDQQREADGADVEDAA